MARFGAVFPVPLLTVVGLLPVTGLTTAACFLDDVLALFALLDMALTAVTGLGLTALEVL